MDRFIKQINRLIVQIGRGKINALDKLYDLTGRLLLSMSRKYLFNKDYVEDLVSDTYLRVVQGSRSFDKTKNGLNWMYKILRNVAYEYNKNYSLEVAADMQSYEVRSRSDNIDDWLNCILITDAVAQLSEQDKRIIFMRYWLGLNLNEIATAFGKSTAAAHYTVQKTLNKLKELVKFE